MSEPMEQQASTPEMAGYQHAVGAMREAIASEVESITMGEVLLAAGEMTAQERRTCRALLAWVAHRIRSRAVRQISSPTPDLSPDGTATPEQEKGASGLEIGLTRDAGSEG